MKTVSNSNLALYTELVFGKDAEKDLVELIKKYGGTKVMLVYGSGSIKKSGLYDRITGMLKDGGMPFVEFGGVKANPLRSHCEKGIKIASEEKVDFLLAVGGGSVIDTTKTIALAVANDGKYWDYYNGTRPEKMAPVGTINTISAAGSEASADSVVVDDINTNFKFFFCWPPCRPVFAIMNPELTYSVSKYQTAAGASDIFSHTFMRFFSTGSPCFLGDEYGIGTLRTVVRYTLTAVEDPTNYRARAELMLAAAFSHNGVTQVGREWNNIGEHLLEAQLSAHYDTAHGAGLAVTMPAFLKYIVLHGTDEQIARVAYFGVRVFDAEPDMENITDVANDGIARFIAWLESIGMPTTLEDLGVPKAEINEAAERCIKSLGGFLEKSFITADADGIRKIYELASKN